MSYKRTKTGKLKGNGLDYTKYVRLLDTRQHMLNYRYYSRAICLIFQQMRFK